MSATATTHSSLPFEMGRDWIEAIIPPDEMRDYREFRRICASHPEFLEAEIALMTKPRRTKITDGAPGSRVYFVQAGPDGPIKIGVAKDVAKRIKSLQTSSPHALRLLGTVPGGYALETEHHANLSSYRMSGEWFKCCPAVIAYVAKVLAE